MKIYSAYSKSHEIFLPWFETIKVVEPDIEIEYTKIEQKCSTGSFKDEGWDEATQQKIEVLLSIIDTDDGSDFFIFSDVDIQFFKPVYNLGKIALKNHDIVFQNDYGGGPCTGFFYCKRNIKTRKLFEEASKFKIDDQNATQYALRLLPEVQYALLPKEYFTYGMFYRHWDGDQNFNIPSNIVMHHANWVKGIDKKLELLEATKQNYINQKFLI